MKPVILVVDDDRAMGELLSDVLGAHAFEVLVSQTGNDALTTVAQRADIALVLLDMILPDTHGLQVLQQLQRTRPELPVVMLSGLGSESDVVVGLEMGADDYIAKPFSSRVVVARVKAVLRRSGALAGEASGAGAGLTFNGWRLDTTRCELYNPQQQAIPLTQGEYGLLLALTHNESTEVFDRTIDVLIMRLRRKIELNPHQPTLIKTLRGLGYVFSADVTHSEKAA
ncbi:response regulator transcription factor [Klebsiella pneumoniae]|uniref:response regulator transcription factor n=1 Tax=Klebsiella pneumoniae TaxID=573 RepID=UPI0011B998B8|nr:response regulator transcription factor [Klebsiella pneumoniae]MBW5590380.1 response regulator [Klebsiella pneumoniae]TWX82789.1 response regulator transcription factor [Klebsiella pneumoniae]HEB5258562.1 response regulator transcription factor [Klebsiella pneumoniae]HED3186106.1 response regulator transcription factor [Klebsiella pneumoniae]HED4012922.1 response regulator transcription factor [Klebsiella pneumoniae]